MFKIYGIIILLSVVGCAAYGAKYYYDSTQAKIEQLAAEKQILDQAVQTNEATITRLNQSAKVQQELNSTLQANLEKAEVGLDSLRSKLSDHDLTRLALKKPGLIEKRINDATENVFDEIESDTGASSTTITNN